MVAVTSLLVMLVAPAVCSEQRCVFRLVEDLGVGAVCDNGPVRHEDHPVTSGEHGRARGEQQGAPVPTCIDERRCHT